MKDLLWLIPLFPLLGAAVNGLVGNRRGWSRRTTSAVALTGSGLALAAALAAIVDWAASVGTAAVHVNRVFTWIPAGFGHTTDGLLANLTIDFALRIDALSAVMLFFVTFVGFLIHVYSVGYMHGEGERPYARYFAYLNLFMFAMLTLVLGANLAVMFVGWEGVGLCSYLLIGFFFEKDWCASAGKKAFIVNRIGDFGFLLAIFWTVQGVRHRRLRRAAGGDRERTRRGSRRRPPRSRCCCSWGQSASPRSCRSTSGCRTRWPARRRSPR